MVDFCINFWFVGKRESQWLLFEKIKREVACGK